MELSRGRRKEEEGILWAVSCLATSNYIFSKNTLS
jgi:hypothetical protein